MLLENRWEGGDTRIGGYCIGIKVGLLRYLLCFVFRERHKEGHISGGNILSQGTKV